MDDDLDHVVMAIDTTFSGSVGCAYYIARHELLCCMEDIQAAGPEVIEAVKTDIQPTVLILSARTATSTNHPLPHEAAVIRPNSDFQYDNGLYKMGGLHAMRSAEDLRLLVPGEDGGLLDETGFTDRSGRLLSVAACIDLDNRMGVGCAGAVMGYLQRRRASEFLQHDPQADQAYRISRMEMFTLRNTMLVSQNTLSALQILQSESHPNVASQGPGNKESLSVYGLFQHLAKTPQGRSRLRQAFLRPSLDIVEITARHDFISIFLRPENQPIAEKLSKSLARIKNMQTVIIALRKGIERGSNNGKIRSGVWASLLEFCFYTIDVADSLREVTGIQSLHLFNVAVDALDKNRLRCIGNAINSVVDLEQSTEEQRTVIQRGIDANLDAVKDAYNGIEEMLSNVANEISDSMPPHVSSRLNVLFLPQLGYHIVVPLDAQTWDGEEGQDWERRFTTSENQYFKNDRMREMDLEWGDLYTSICDREIELSHELAQTTLEDARHLIRASDFCGQLDYLLALVHGALQFKLTRPRMVEQNVIVINAGRHILHETTVASLVPNDTNLCGGDGVDQPQGHSMILLTGPNYSGKSVYKKQVALIVYMAQIGSFVPAESATLGITDKILTRINTAETVSKAQSAFMIDLQQIGLALKCCTRQSLLVIDEFGKGTETCDGAGLVSGVLQYLLSLGPESPKVVASTHFHEIFERGDFDRYGNLMLAHMEVRVDATERHPDVTYLYNLRPGRSTLSYGNQCAAMNGIPSSVVQRATSLADLIIRGEDLVTACASLPAEELAELATAEAASRRFLSMRLNENDGIEIDREHLL